MKTQLVSRKVITLYEERQTNDETVISEKIPDVCTNAETNGSGNKPALLNETVHVEPDIVMSWTWDDLKCAQENDKDMACIIEWMRQSTKQPSWQLIALKSHDTKTLWYQWPRLQIKDGVLKRRFDDIETKEERWQIILPCIFREEFLRIAHSGMTGHKNIGHKKTISHPAEGILAILVYRFEDAYQYLQALCTIS